MHKNNLQWKASFHVKHGEASISPYVPMILSGCFFTLLFTVVLLSLISNCDLDPVNTYTRTNDFIHTQSPIEQNRMTDVCKVIHLGMLNTYSYLFILQ